jgi:hypothetical protein
LPKMSRSILILVVLSLIVSLIQIKNPYFFASPELTDNVANIIYLAQRRIFSIFSWIRINSLGISFPILISILLSVYTSSQSVTLVTILSGSVVSFLSKARYFIISIIIVLSQLFFNSKAAITKKIYVLVLIICSAAALIWFANIYDYNIQQVINARILENDTGMASAKVRIASLEVFLIKFPEHPLFGVGPVTRPDVLQLLRGLAPVIHIGYLAYLYFYGIFGSLLLFLSLFYLLKSGWHVGKKLRFYGIFYGLLTFCFANLTFVYFNLSEFGIILAVIYLKFYNDKMLTELPEIAQNTTPII